MDNKFLNITGLSTLITQLKGLFATKTAVESVEQDTNMYIVDIDYSQLEFDKDEIITEEGAQ
jgi:hypothetical protein